MAIIDSNINYQNLIQIGDTLRVATFVEIRDALTKRLKEIYGNDIDISTASADGQLVNDFSLIINNILQTFKMAYDSLDPAVAKGKYLDILCSYNNIYRITESYSTAELWIYNDTEHDIPGSTVTELLFMDKAGNQWTWFNPQTTPGTYVVDFPSKKATAITGVICNNPGAIQAPGGKFIDSNGHETDDVNDCDWTKESTGWINQFVNITDLKLWQYKDAVVGHNEETDEALRSRRYQALGNQSVSVLEGLNGSLLNLTGIKDAFVYNRYQNDGSLMPVPTNDGTTVLGHSIYIALRYEDNVNIPDVTIGRLIYNKLTPGIGTTPYLNPTTYENMTAEQKARYKSFTVQRTAQIQYTVYWKKCDSINPQIVITFLCNTNYDIPTSFPTGETLADHHAITVVEKAIVKNLQQYITDVKIDGYLQRPNLMNVTQTGDRLKDGVSTFFVQSCSIGGNDNDYPANLSYFKYDDSDFKFGYATVGNTTTGTLTIG